MKTRVVLLNFLTLAVPGTCFVSSYAGCFDKFQTDRGRQGKIQLQLCNTSDRSSSSTTDFSDFDRTSGLIKAFIAGMTNAIVGLSVSHDPTHRAGVSPKLPLSLDVLEAGLRQDYANNYLWTGNINDQLYEDDCSFTDPTLSFRGLDTYKRNIESLQGILTALVTRSRSELYDIQVEPENNCVRTRWRMVGNLRLPWGPTIDVIGRTKFTYDEERGNRIRSYDEVWEIKPAEALMQLFRPGLSKDTPPDT